MHYSISKNFVYLGYDTTSPKFLWHPQPSQYGDVYDVCV